MKIKKIWIAALLFCMVFQLAACSNTNENQSGTNDNASNKITIWAWDESFNIAAATQAKELYMKNHPDAQIDVVTMAREDIVQKLHAGLSSKVYKGLPNIVLIEDYNIQNFLKAYPGEIRDLSASVQAANFTDYKLAVSTDGDKIYGVPFDSGVAALFYRTDYIEKAGYTKADMDNLTWEKYIEIGKDVKAKAGVDMLTLDPSDLGQIRMMLQSAGAWYVKEDGTTVDLENNQALKDAITIYKALYDAKIVKQVSDWNQFTGAFQKGEVASVPTGCWIASSIMNAADQSGKWAVAAIPRMANNSKSVNATNLGGAGWYVLQNVGNAEASEKFLAETFGSSNELMNILVEKINLVSTLKSASSAENYNKPSPYFSNQEIFQLFSNWTKEIPKVNYGIYTYTIEDLFTESVQAIMNGASIDDTLKKAQAQAQSVISQS